MRHTATTFWRGVALLTIMTTAAPAMPTSPSQRAQVFAVCAGRMDALATHKTAMRDAEAGRLRAQADDFDLLLDASLPDALNYGVPPELPRQWRAQGWIEIAGHLADSAYSFDPGLAERSEQWMDRKVADCQDMLLS